MLRARNRGPRVAPGGTWDGFLRTRPARGRRLLVLLFVHIFNACATTRAHPSSGPSSRALTACSAVGAAPTGLHAYEILQWHLGSDPAMPGTLKVRASLKNVASFAQPYPLLKLVLEDRWGERVREREFEPAEYLTGRRRRIACSPPAQQAMATISIVDPGPDAEGFASTCACAAGRVVCAARTRKDRAAMRIGPYELRRNLALAPMAGVTDLPFRLLCRQHGRRHRGGRDAHQRRAPVAHGKIATAHGPHRRGRAARRADRGRRPADDGRGRARNVDAGAQIIDINMGCPAKKVCNRAAGSALMKDEPLVGRFSRPSSMQCPCRSR